MLHRLAFRTLLGPEPSPDDCLELFRAHRSAFEAAAAAKIVRARLGATGTFHLTSRDLRVELGERGFGLTPARAEP